MRAHIHIELQRRQTRIQRVAGDQLRVGTNRNQLALIHHRYPVGILHSSQAVGDNQSGAPLHQAGQGLLDQVLTLGIKGAGGLIQQQNRCIHQQRPGNGQPLPLPA